MNNTPTQVPAAPAQSLTALEQAAQSPAARPGHFDELRGRVSNGAAAAHDAMQSVASSQDTTLAWSQFFAHCSSDGLGSLKQRWINLAPQMGHDGADAENEPQSGSLSLFPLIISPASWQQLEVGVLQRVRLLERVMADVYGAQRLLTQGLLPPALVQGHPGYLRALHGVVPLGGTHLHVAAFDLARGPDGNWWLLAQHTQAPSGLGDMLKNRLTLSRQFPQAVAALQVQGLAGSYHTLLGSIKSMSPLGQNAHVVLLTPGPYNASYFEQAYLANFLGIGLVQGQDLIVRDQHLYLKTLRGLVPVHALLKWPDDQFLDPLELRADSTLGVPGLLQVIRAGNVLLANALGSAFLESPALLGFLPALAQALLGEDLLLPSLPTWWCGERAVQAQVLPRLKEWVIQATYPGSHLHGSFDAVLGRSLTEAERAQWVERILRHSDEYTLAADMPRSQMPTWQSDTAAVVPHSVMLRVFAVSQGAQSWRVLPGGLARVAGGSADVWVMTNGQIDPTSLLPATLSQQQALVSSRTAENLFWLGRYTVRAENLVQLARLILARLGYQDPPAPALLTWLGRMALNNTLVLPGLPALTAALPVRREFARALIASLGSNQQATSVGYNLRALRLAGAAVRERLSQQHWSLLQRAEDQFFASCAEPLDHIDGSSVQALATLKTASDQLTAMTGLQTDGMTRDDGWLLLCIGRHIERLGFLAAALRLGFETGSVQQSAGIGAMLDLFGSLLVKPAQRCDIAALLDLLVLEQNNPHSLAWVAHALRAGLVKLAGSAPDPLNQLATLVPDPVQWPAQQLCWCDANGHYTALIQLLLDCSQAAFQVSQHLGSSYFSHTGQSGQSLGA